ncbi:DNA topoisomerase 6 subunit B-like protein [Drosera capensis]
MRQMAVITPYAQFLFKFVSETTDKNVTIRFARRTDQNLLEFLQHEFVNIGKAHAERLIGEMGPDFNPKMPVKSFTSQQIVRIHQLFRQAKFDDPSGDCLSSAGEYNLRLGIIKELHPDMVATYSGSAQVFEGHPFIVEAGVSVGGKDVKRVSTVWSSYKINQNQDKIGAFVRSSYTINQNQDKIGVFVSIVSTKIPFKGTGKEYIGDDISEIACAQLKSKIVKKIQAREQQERKRNLSSYIPDAANAIYDVLKEMAQLHASKKQRYEYVDAEILRQVCDGSLTTDVLKERLAKHVMLTGLLPVCSITLACCAPLISVYAFCRLLFSPVNVDYEMALEYATQIGVSEEPEEAIHLQALDPKISFIDLQSPVFVYVQSTASDDLVQSSSGDQSIMYSLVRSFSTLVVSSWKHPQCHRSQSRLSLGPGSKASTGIRLQYAVVNSKFGHGNIIRKQNPQYAGFCFISSYRLTKMSKPLPQIAIIGAGIFVKTQYIPRLSEISHLVTVKSIWSRSKKSSESAAEIARKVFPGVESKWGDEGFDEIVKDEGIIGVAVVLAAQLQVDISTKLLKAGKHVLQGLEDSRHRVLEPSIEMYIRRAWLIGQTILGNSNQAIQSIQRLKRHQLGPSVYKSSLYSPSNPLVWAVAENYRFETAFLEGRKLVGELGDLMIVQLIVEGSMNNTNPYFSSSWRRNFNGCFILDMGVHMIAGLRMLVGCEVSSVSAFTHHVDVALPPPDNVSSILKVYDDNFEEQSCNEAGIL